MGYSYSGVNCCGLFLAATKNKMKKIKRITSTRKLAKEEAEKYNKIRERVAKELPELIKRHYERMSK